MRVGLLLCVVAAVLIAVPGEAQECSAEYSGDQCLQINNDGSGSTGPGGGGGGACPYYLCGNAGSARQSAMVWCPETEAFVDCPIFYCRYSPCSGTNCYPTSMNCSACPSQSGNNAHESDCPRT